LYLSLLLIGLKNSSIPSILANRDPCHSIPLLQIIIIIIIVVVIILID